MWTTSFWKDAAERALKTFAQTFLTFIVVGQTGVVDLDWVQAGSVALIATLASVLTSVVSSKVGDSTTAALRR